MCGLYGCIAPAGKQWNTGTISALTWANRERGTDSAGFFDSSGKMKKRAGDPFTVIAQPKVWDWLANSEQTQWFVAGHTRQATRGKVNRRNSHPFRYGKIIGSHNGMCDAPTKFTVDSEHLFWALSKAHGDYNVGLADICGYWGLTWYDGEFFYLMNHNGELSITEVDGVFYYSSNARHLQSCTGGEVHKLGDGEVWKFDKNGFVGASHLEDSDVPAFVSTASFSTGYGKYRTSKTRGYTSNSYEATTRWYDDEYNSEAANCSTSASGAASTVREYDQDWVDCWTTYCSEDEKKSVHGMSDDEFDEFERFAG